LSCAASTVLPAVLDRTRTTSFRQPRFPSRCGAGASFGPDREAGGADARRAVRTRDGRPGEPRLAGRSGVSRRSGVSGVPRYPAPRGAPAAWSRRVSRPACPSAHASHIPRPRIPACGNYRGGFGFQGGSGRPQSPKHSV
jgi:hypothetical protein